MTETDKAWLAGLIDGEGCIYARVDKNGYINSRLQIIMTHYPTMKRLYELSNGGEPRVQSKAASNKLKAWRWCLMAQKAASLLREVLPFMVTKRRQAEIMIELMSMRGLDRKNNDKPRQIQLVNELKAAKNEGTEQLCT